MRLRRPDCRSRRRFPWRQSCPLGRGRHPRVADRLIRSSSFDPPSQITRLTRTRTQLISQIAQHSLCRVITSLLDSRIHAVSSSVGRVEVLETSSPLESTHVQLATNQRLARSFDRATLATSVQLRAVACTGDEHAMQIFEGIWRRRPDLNRGWRFCRPLPYLLATAPL